VAPPIPEVTLDPVESAKAAGLRYVSADAPGIVRKRAGKGFAYYGPDGRAIRDAEVLARIRSLVIPPAWTDVWICPIPNGHLQAVGRDAKRRKQYRYHPRWRQTRDETKYTRMLAFARALPAIRAQAEEEVRAAEAEGKSEPELRFLRFHGANWARRAEADITSDHPRSAVEGVINAVRIGDGVIVTGPGEVFTEIGMAVKERSPADVTLYAGYTNGCVSYFPTESEYPRGGYEPLYGNKTYGLPVQVSPECDRILVQTGAELACALFPERDPPHPGDWKASGGAPSRLPATVLRRPPRG
jgi:hypothetical protein